MSGIVGIWNFAGQPVEKALLAKMSAAIAHQGGDEEGFWIDGTAGLGCQLFRVTPESLTESQPYTDGSGVVVVFDGRLDNRDELLQILEGSSIISSVAPDPVLIAGMYNKFGERFAEYLTGDFALGLFDSKRQQLLLARDPMGLRPLYYYNAGNIFLFASEIKGLLAHPGVCARPNDGMLAEFFLGGRGRDTRRLTFFDEIFSLLPAEMATVTSKGVVTRQYWDFDPTRQVRLGSFEEYAEAFRHYFEQAVRRRMRTAYPVSVFVSGGLDSSSVFCAAEDIRRNAPETFPRIAGVSLVSTSGLTSNESDEKAFVQAIERDYDIAMDRVPFYSENFADGCRESIAQVEAPFLNTYWYDTHRFLRAASDRGARVVLTGDWAEQMFGEAAYMVDLFCRLEWRELRTHLKEFRRWDHGIAPRALRRQFFMNFLRCRGKYFVPNFRLSTWLRHKLNKTPIERRKFTKTFGNVSRRHNSMSKWRSRAFKSAHARAVYGYARSAYNDLFLQSTNKIASANSVEMAYPFLDRDLVSFLIAIPGEIESWKGVPKALLREAMREVLPEAIVKRIWKTDSRDFTDQGMAQDYARLADSLTPDGLAVRLGYVKADAMAKECIHFDKAVLERSSFPGNSRRFIALELWLQTYFGSEAVTQLKEAADQQSDWSETLEAASAETL